jgi:hypothetical protein
VVFESLAFLIAVPVHEEAVWPMHGDFGRRNCIKVSDSEKDRVLLKSGNR